MQTHLMQWAVALGVPFLAVAVAFASWWSNRSSNRWQVRIDREKLKHDLYDRRFAIYMAFHELLVAVVEKSDLTSELRKANAARAHSPFLLDAELTQYLSDLHQEAFRINMEIGLLQDESVWSPQARSERASLLGSSKLALATRIPELVQKFECLKLTDLSKSGR